VLGVDVVESNVAGIGLSEAIQGLRAELVAAMAAGAGEPIQFPIAKMTVELQTVATKGVDGKAGFRVPVVEVELGGGAKWQRENTQTVTIEFGSPVDREGRPVKVASASNQIKG
jgi:NTP-dependent ternary system trypsin peptidase co-occuring protein